MKVLPMMLAGLLLLVVVIVVLQKDLKDGSSPGEEEATVVVAERKAVSTDRTKGRKRSMEDLMSNFPYAGDRLEELYLKYPNLRPAESELAVGVTLIDELNRLFEEMDEALRFPAEMRGQLNGREEWDEEMVGKYLDEKKEALDRLIELSKLSTEESRFRYSFMDSSPEIINVNKGSKLLSLALIHAVRTGDDERARQYFDALGKMGEAVSRPFVIHSLVGSAITNLTQQRLAGLAEAGFDVSGYVDRVSVPRSAEVMMDSLRREVGGVVSYLEAAKGADQGEFVDYIFKFVGEFSTDDGEHDSRLMREEIRTMNIDTFQDDYARMISEYMAAFPETVGGENLDEQVLGDFEFRIADQGVSEGRALVLSAFLDPLLRVAAKQPVKAEQSRRELLTHHAMQQAAAAGVAVERVEDLVPRYLPAVPVNAKTGEPFVYDGDAGGVNFGESVR
ncbi:MAG: hypothetical protein ACSHYF_06950 [Verrucomicrobiaceae bacterium]